MAREKDWVDRLVPGGPSGPQSIAAERARSAVDTDALADHIMGPEYLARQQRILDVLTKDKLFSKENVYNLSRPDRYKLGLARGKRMRQLHNALRWSDEDHDMAKFLVDEISPYQVHTTMFQQTLREQTTDAQRAEWLKAAEDWDIIGAYAQTEMGHGSNVQGIETTATWDKETKEFILHSPTLTASKWWNGSMGRTANHAVIVAQLMLPDPADATRRRYKSYGPHTFIAQIRDMKTHQTLDGVAAGDIGPKFGYASMDNAYLLLNNLRVPHEALLARYSSVDKDTGAYRPPKNRAMIYGSLTGARMRIVMAARLMLARALTVAVRYCSIRRQFRSKDKPQGEAEELQVLDYPTVQVRLFPLLATVFALHYSGQYMGEIYRATRDEIESKGDLSKLAEMHSLSSGLKSLSTELALGGMETARRTMGGHGFGNGTGLLGIQADYTSKPTVEGDNWMITQQMARYLIKTARLIVQNPHHRPTNHTEEVLLRYWQKNGSMISSSPVAPRAGQALDVLNNTVDIAEAFEQRAAYLTFKAYEAVDVQKLGWNSLLIQLHNLSNAQSEAVLVYHFHKGLVTNKTLPASTMEVMWLLFRLFAYHTMSRSGRDFVRAGAIDERQLDILADEKIMALLSAIRPHAVSLVDAFKFPDYLLNSSLGRYDGKVYEDLFHRAHRLNPLNKIVFNPDYKTDEIVMGSEDAGKILSKL